ncbi:transcription factor bHLH52-like [Magnolia sinica]|uniref:transcription factor bHLH52-like n=1 Tax=Magnolia sinica TaxID=86752 RepID=UPI002658FF74|nr:transcription factor bHLH52-like [Magnolia sinica]
MVLSYRSNLAAFQNINPEMATLLHSDTSRDLCFCDSCVVLNALIDPFFNPDDFIQFENSTHLLPQFSTTDPLLNFPPEIFPADEFEFNYCPKRIKSNSDFQSPDFTFGSSMGSWYSSPEFSSEFILSPAEFQIPVMGFPNGFDGSKKSIGTSVSAQSVAARQRRKKISEKTQELGKLIPGGNKLNTAEMFHAAFKYVKFLQAQVGILELMGPTQMQESKVATDVEGLNILLSSPRIQEKLYEEEKCMVPKGLVQALAKDQEIQSRPSISRDLDLLVQSMGC